MATGAILVVLVLAFGPISGAHLNPAVSVVFALRRELTIGDCASYAVAQTVGAIVGVLLAHGMFSQPLLQLSTTVRTGPGQWLAELVATFGLIGAILCFVAKFASRERCVRRRAVYCSRLLVYLFDIIREPGCYGGTSPERHICWYRPCECSRICDRTVRGCASGVLVLRVVARRADRWPRSQLLARSYRSWLRGRVLR